MPRRWSLGLDRLHYEGIDGEYEHLKKTAQAHRKHDAPRGQKWPSRNRPGDDVPGPSSSDASTPQTRRRWGR
ncbi:hypothetical protein [Streptomyces gobitricini]|uniref:Transposase n=1 Tax=Streptomyces gobitricini TaxID=68211 RepID=A0ABN3LDP0_9ACTN